MSAAALSMRASARARIAAFLFSVSEARATASCFAFSSDLARSSLTSDSAFLRAASMVSFPSSTAAASAALAAASASAFICLAFSSAALIAVIASKDIDTPPAENDGTREIIQLPPIKLYPNHIKKLQNTQASLCIVCNEMGTICVTIDT